MKKFAIVLCFLIVAFAAKGEYPESKYISIPQSGISGWDNASSTFRPLSVTSEGKLSIDGAIELDALLSYKDDLGTPTRALVDSGDRVLVNLGAEGIGINPTEWQQQTVTLVADTAQDITTGITGSRKFIIVKSQDTSKQFWVSVDGAAVIGTNGMLVQDWVKLDAPETVTVSVISSETLDLSVMEAGY